MFEYSLENGRKQFKNGLILMLVGVGIIIFGCVCIGLPCFFANVVAGAVITGIFGAVGVIFIVIGWAKKHFGAVVYHAERTANKNAGEVEREFAKYKAEILESKDKIMWDYDEKNQIMHIKLNKGQWHKFKATKETYDYWKKLSDQKRIKWYLELIKKH